MPRRLILTALGLFSMVAGAHSTVQLRADGGPPRPFHGAAVGAVTQVVVPNQLVVEYSGTATHLGRFTQTEYLTIGEGGAIDGTMVFTAANGDELWLDFAGAFISPTTAAGSYTFTGGTGRFQGATGTAEFEAFTPDGVKVTATFAGTIHY